MPLLCFFRWSYLYFIVWWLFSVVIVMQLFTALIIEASIILSVCTLFATFFIESLIPIIACLGDKKYDLANIYFRILSWNGIRVLQEGAEEIQTLRNLTILCLFTTCSGMSKLWHHSILHQLFIVNRKYQNCNFNLWQ